jgi:two-component system, sensor histidine kinase PdtaS
LHNFKHYLFPLPNILAIIDYKKYVILVLICLIALHISAQQNTLSVSELRSELQKAKTDSAIGKMSGFLAWKIKFDSPKESMQLTEKEIAIGYKIKDYIQLAHGYKTKAYLLSLQEKIAESLRYYDSSIYYGSKANSDYELAHCYTMMAGIYADFADYDKAIDIHTKALKYSQKSGSPYMIAVCSNNLASVSKDAGRKSESILFAFTIAKNNFLLLDNWVGCAVSSVNIAQLYADINETNKAVAEMKISMQYLQKSTANDYEKGTITNEYATVYYQLKKYEEAKKQALISYALLSKLDVPDNLLATENMIVKTYFALNEKDIAEKYAKEMLALAIAQKAKLQIRNAYKALSEIEEYKKNYPLSLLYYKQFDAWNDSIFNDIREKSISNIEEKALIAQKENELKYNSLKNNRENELLKIKNSSLKKQKLFAIIAIVMLAMLGGLLFLSNKNKQKINADLEIQKKKVELQAQEKGMLIQEIHHRVKNNLTMLKGLLYLQAKASNEEETKNILKESQARIQSMALVHQSLYDEDKGEKLNCILFLKKLFTEISTTFQFSKKEILFNVTGDCPNINISQSIPLSLIMNELVTNSLKYAFTNINNGNVIVTITEEINKIMIVYTDNGPGLPANVSLYHGGFGFKILNLLIKQLNGKIGYKFFNNESTFTIEIPTNQE